MPAALLGGLVELVRDLDCQLVLTSLDPDFMYSVNPNECSTWNKVAASVV